MCDYSIVAGFLATALVAITAASVLIGIAIVANLSFWGAPGALPVAVSAAASSGIAASAIFSAMAAGAVFMNCITVNYGGVCSAEIAGFNSWMGLLGAAFAVQTAAIVAAVASSWIPFAGAGPLAGWAALIGTEVGFLIKVNIAYNALRDCINNTTKMETLPGWISILFVVAIIVGIFLTFILVGKTWNYVFPSPARG